jgi:nicotinamidase-related amidase
MTYTIANAPLATLEQVVEFLRRHQAALIGVDPMRTFTAQPVLGRLSTARGHEVMDPINRLAALPVWAWRELLKDWHPHEHVSYIEIRRDLMADAAKRGVPYMLTLAEVQQWTDRDNPLTQEAIRAGITLSWLRDSYLPAVPGNSQMLWPQGRHAEQGSTDAVFHDALDLSYWQGVTPKGTKSRVDSYGGYADNGGFADTGLEAKLRKRAVNAQVTVGLCLKYCVNYTATQGITRGFPTMVILDACRPVFDADEHEAIEELIGAGALLADTNTVVTAAAQVA